MYIKRLLYKELEQLASEYKVVTITGPRQSGKTTLCKNTFPSKEYLSLEDPDVRLVAQNDPRAFLQNLKDGAVIDEIQRVPELISYIQTIVDTSNQKGLFILTGSNQLLLNAKVSQSLAGRTALLTLLPLSFEEIKRKRGNVYDSIIRGSYPALFADEMNVSKYYKNYISTYLERDVKQLSNIQDTLVFHNFIRLCAGRSGQLLDLSDIANSVGISVNTVKNWISILEASYIVFRLPPYFENFNKRIIKSPKMYFYDTGVLCSLLGIEDEHQLETHPLRGYVFENQVVLELKKHFNNLGENPDLYFYRDSSGKEVDVIFKRKNKFISVEIKSTMTFNPSLLDNLQYFKNLAVDTEQNSFLVYNGSKDFTFQDHNILNVFNMKKLYNTL